MGRYGVCGIGNEAEVGLVILVERGWNADNDRIHVNQPGVVGGSREALRLGSEDFIRADTADVGSALSNGIDLALVNVEPGHGELLFAEQQGQRQSHVT